MKMFDGIHLQYAPIPLVLLSDERPGALLW